MVRVAGSTPVNRSERQHRAGAPQGQSPFGGKGPGGVAEWLGSGLQSRLRGFESRLHLGLTHQAREFCSSRNERDWRSGSALP